MENVVRAWSPPPPRARKKGSGKGARSGDLSASVVWRSNAHLGAYRNKHLRDYHDEKMKKRLHSVKSTVSTRLDPAVSRTRRRGKKKRKKRIVTKTLTGGALTRSSSSRKSRTAKTTRKPSQRRDALDEAGDGSGHKLSLEEAIAVLKAHSVQVQDPVVDAARASESFSDVSSSESDDFDASAALEAALAKQKAKDEARKETKKAEKKKRQSARAQQKSVARLSTVTTRHSSSDGARSAYGAILSPAARRAASLSAKRVGSPRQHPAGAKAVTRNQQPRAKPAPARSQTATKAASRPSAAKVAAKQQNRNSTAKDPTGAFSRRAPKLTSTGETKASSRMSSREANKAAANSRSAAKKGTAKTSTTRRALGARVVKQVKLTTQERVQRLYGLCRRLQADENILDPYNKQGLRRAIYAADADQMGFIDNVALRPIIETFTTVSGNEWAQIKGLFDKDGDGFISYMKLLRFFEKPVPEEENEPAVEAAKPAADAEGPASTQQTGGDTEPPAVSTASTAKPPVGSKALSSPRRLSAAVSAAAAASSQSNSTTALNASRRSLNSSVRSTNSYNYDSDEFDSDGYGDDFDSIDGGSDEEDILSRSKRLSVAKVEANENRKSQEFVNLEKKLAAVPAAGAQRLKDAINAAGQVEGNSRAIDLTNLRLILSAHVAGLDKSHWKALEVCGWTVIVWRHMHPFVLIFAVLRFVGALVQDCIREFINEQYY